MDIVVHCSSATKFDSGCGWPAFFDALPGAVLRNEDRSHGMTRTEIVCAKCGGHLGSIPCHNYPAGGRWSGFLTCGHTSAAGHVFKGEGYDTPTNERHCVNSVSLRFEVGQS